MMNITVEPYLYYWCKECTQKLYSTYLYKTIPDWESCSTIYMLDSAASNASYWPTELSSRGGRVGKGIFCIHLTSVHNFRNLLRNESYIYHSWWKWYLNNIQLLNQNDNTKIFIYRVFFTKEKCVSCAVVNSIVSCTVMYSSVAVPDPDPVGSGLFGSSGSGSGKIPDPVPSFTKRPL